MFLKEVTSFWSATLVHYTGYTQDQLAPTALDLLDLVNQAARGETKLMGAHAKYKSNSQHKKLVLQRHLQPEVDIKNQTPITYMYRYNR